MVSNPDETIPTRRSLIGRLRNWDDQESWQEFFNTYWKLIYSVALKFGLSAQEAEDVVQETVLSIAKKMDAYRYDPAVCSFKGWLMHVTRLRIMDQLRKRQPHQRAEKPGPPDITGTDTVERVPDPAGLELESIWDEEWKKNLLDAAMERLKRQVKAEHYQIFYLLIVQQVGMSKVAKMLGTTVAQVYLIKHRLVKLLKKAVKQVEANRL